jgi:hypothetical protein
MLRTECVLIALSLSVVQLLHSQTATVPPDFKSDEYLILGNANRGAGEPMIAVNPKDPNNIVVVGMSTWHQIKGQLPPQPGAPPPAGAGNRGAGLMLGLRTPNSTVMSMAVTHDGGVTWKWREDPIRQGTHSRCADPVAAAGPDGTFYVGCINREPQPDFLATDAMSVSTDGGDTWGPRIWLIGNDKPYRTFAPGLNPIRSETVSSPFDRPWIVIDQSNNTLYAVAAHGSTGEPPRPQSYVMASHDRGQTFSPIYSFDSPAYRQSGGGDAAAANGVLGVAFVAGAVPDNLNAHCPCVVFGASKDEGKSFEYHLLPNFDSVPQGPGGGLKIAADPSKPGRFAILSSDSSHNRLQVRVTEDTGGHWTGPIEAGATPEATPTKSWFDYSPQGDLAVMWRAVYKDKSYDAWSSLSRDGGHTFSAPLRVSHAISPPTPRERGNFLFGDDISDLVVNDRYVYTVWGDSRAGFQGTWFGRVPLSAY